MVVGDTTVEVSVTVEPTLVVIVEASRVVVTVCV